MPDPDSASRFALASEIFARSWDVYEKVVVSNYMCHEQMEETIRRLLPQPRGFSILDLGCGDGSMTARALAGTAPGSYTGIELVEAAATVADRNLAPLVPLRTFKIGNLVNEIRTISPKSIDVILASYSVHHLSPEEKERLFADVAQVLKTSGTFFFIDLLPREGESRATYLSRFHAHAESMFSALTAEEKASVRTHMNESDWPEPLSALSAMAQQAGFSLPRLHFRDHAEFYALLTFSIGNL